MRKIVTLLAFLGVLVAGIAIEAPANDGKSPIAARFVSAKDNGNSSTVDTVTENVCLYALIYADGANYFWAAEMFNENCTSAGVYEEIWTNVSYLFPQSCFEAPLCLTRIVGSKEIRPALKKALPAGKSYIDILDVKVQSSASGAETWDPKDCLKESGELKKTFVKVKNASDKYFAVRLSSGIVKMDKLRLSRKTSCCGSTIADRKIQIGFETEMTESDVLELPEAFPISHKRYSNCPTTFTLRVGGNDYSVTTTVENGVRFSQDAATSALPIVNNK